MDVLCRETDHMHLVPDDPCYCSVTFLDEEYKERDVLIERARPSAPLPRHGARQVPDAAARHVCRLRVPRQLRADQRRDRSRRGVGRGQRLRERGPMFNIYHVSPHETQNPDEFVTEVCFPVREA